MFGFQLLLTLNSMGNNCLQCAGILEEPTATEDLTSTLCKLKPHQIGKNTFVVLSTSHNYINGVKMAACACRCEFVNTGLFIQHAFTLEAFFFPGSLLSYTAHWNMNSRHCPCAQAVINIIFKNFTADELLDLPDLSKTLEGLIPYTGESF
jgi:hypothetical protein